MAEYSFFTEFSLKIFFAVRSLLTISGASYKKKLLKVFAFCLPSKCAKWFSLRHIFDARAALEGKPIFFNTFHSSLSFLVFF